MSAPQARNNLWWSIYEASDRADFSGYFFLPNLTPSEQMNSLSERAIAERSDWLYKNVGAVKMVIDGLAVDEVGTGLWPKWTTGEADFDKAMTDAFHYANHDPRIFSADGLNDAYSCQFNIRRCIRLYGDAFGQLLRPSPGSIMPQHALFPGYMIDNFGDEKPEDGWTRGVKRNAMGRPVAYRVLNKEHASGYTDVPADDILHYHDPFLPGQVRGVPSLAAVCKKLFRREDIGKALANGTLARERLGYVLEFSDQSSQAGPVFVPGAREVSTVKNEDGSRFTVQKIFGFDSEDQVPIPELPKGSKMNTVESNRPGTAVMEYQDSILREVAWNEIYPPEYVFDLAGMRQGTLARLVLQKVKNVINGKREFQLKPQFINRHSVFFTWMLIRAGYFDALNIKVPEQWWKHKIVAPADNTVDIAREGRLYDERVSTNKMSISSFHALAGEDDDATEDENLAVIDRRLIKLDALNARRKTKFTYFDMWPRTPSSGASDVATGANAPSPDEPVSPPAVPPRKPQP